MAKWSVSDLIVAATAENEEDERYRQGSDAAQAAKNEATADQCRTAASLLGVSAPTRERLLAWAAKRD